MHPELKRLVPVGLPFGPKARLVLMHINQQAIVAKSPEIEVQDSLTKFVHRTLWPSTVRLSPDHWENLKNHAVPLDEVAIAALSHNAMALDIYAWLAQRLHRVPPVQNRLYPVARTTGSIRPELSTG